VAHVIGPYAGVLRLPGARAFVAAGIVGRSAHLMTVLSIVFGVSATGGYALAGAVAAGYQVGYAGAGPFSARLCDRLGQRRVLPWATAATAVARTGLVVAVWREAPGWEIVVLAALAGTVMPSVGSLVRARWSHLLDGSTQLSTALALESVVDDLIVVAGPVAVAVLATSVAPVAGLTGASVLAVAGLGGLSALRSTEPPARPDVHPDRGRVLSAPGFPWLLLTFVAVGATLYSFELVTVAFCQAHGSKASPGWVLATTAAMSAVAGLWYGSRPWASPPERRLVWALALFAAGAALLVAAWSTPTLVLPAFVLGAAVSPVMIAGFSTVGRCVSKWAITEGMTWMTTAMGAGIVIGTLAGGTAVDAWNTQAAYAVTAGYATIAIPAALLLCRALERNESAMTPPTAAAEWA
jgi:MFS family permease